MLRAVRIAHQHQQPLAVGRPVQSELVLVVGARQVARLTRGADEEEIEAAVAIGNEDQLVAPSSSRRIKAPGWPGPSLRVKYKRRPSAENWASKSKTAPSVGGSD